MVVASTNPLTRILLIAEGSCLHLGHGILVNAVDAVASPMPTAWSGKCLRGSVRSLLAAAFVLIILVLLMVTCAALFS